MVPMHDKMASRLSMNQPTPDPSQEGSTRFCQFPSWERLAVGSWSQCTVSKSWGLSMMHGKNAVGAFHEPPPLPALSPALGGGEGGRRPGDSNRFMAQMHGTKVVETLHEPPFPNPNDE